ncbi:MAG: hypothetical protein A3J65_02025 [Candidatus Buchananbacteria bacterium RIFCSPHIGHO2_02_FULL_45_11b]|uniref:Uncharacterized protein n=4 Tax=Candidatus Buchananiibacteriota TaxID=1817903 RepID=A0A1G1YRX2_9BACT|nr:MAG: hypothetical protein A2663_00405 [Candidatus Buchananbacteria bacterium RIFCSPHIGHO2_01_FULL_46_12]OGY51891.1 MAG: hypothetical protein A3J65_02025 [Candidatus Buchananbacteria bacterium RIFCSPHIGHO2_02_FULL_45_11b]OGY54177.1 MAG: hypothetical protein A3B15_01065 [Candidatus Buchananbacteria bacterium RIFCSPLOWO2_01_FULL_45_31]OGY57962.1 MAG: hypothetical protein A3H67_01720 [Candidatus Buchananbacteria bacterium RIFCSPLOWO2_02_FULL_46_11b]
MEVFDIQLYNNLIPLQFLQGVLTLLQYGVLPMNNHVLLSLAAIETNRTSPQLKLKLQLQ